MLPNDLFASSDTRDTGFMCRRVLRRPAAVYEGGQLPCGARGWGCLPDAHLAVCDGRLAVHRAVLDRKHAPPVGVLCDLRVSGNPTPLLPVSRHVLAPARWWWCTSD